MLERLDARGDRARDALIERRGELERAFEHERRMRRKIEAELGSAIPPVGVQPPSQPSRLVEEMLIDVRSRVESGLERERQERMSADADLRAAIGVDAAAGNPSAEEPTQPPQSAVPVGTGGAAVGSAMTPVPGSTSNGGGPGTLGQAGRGHAGNGKPRPSMPAPTAPEAASGGERAGVAGAPQPNGRPSLEELAERLVELDAEEDRIRVLLHQGHEDLEGRVIRERRARRGAEAQLRSARGLGPKAPPRRTGRHARPKADVKHPDLLRARAHSERRRAEPMAGVDKRWSKNRAPHRRLVEGSRGLDVAQLQHALNHRLKARSEFGYERIRADGEFGPATRRAWVAMARAIGLPYAKCTVANQLLMRNPAKRGPSMVKKGRAWLARARAARKREQMSGGPGAKAVAFLVKRAGWTEHPADSNDAPFLAHWRRALNMPEMRGQPWCGFGVIAAWHYGAHKAIPRDTIFTPNIVNRARNGQGFTAVHASAARPGDLVVINFPGESAVADHVGLARGPARGGMIPTVECNTSAGNSGSQANGGGIFLRSRPVGLIAIVARPK